MHERLSEGIGMTEPYSDNSTDDSLETISGPLPERRPTAREWLRRHPPRPEPEPRFVDWGRMGAVWWDDLASGGARDRAIRAGRAGLSVIGGLSELTAATTFGGPAGVYFGLHGAGNMAGGIGDYIDIFDQTNDRDWNVTRQGYMTAAETFLNNPEAGRRAFHAMDGLMGIANMMQPVYVTRQLPFGIEHHSRIPYSLSFKASPVVNTVDALGIQDNIWNGLGQW